MAEALRVRSVVRSVWEPAAIFVAGCLLWWPYALHAQLLYDDWDYIAVVSLHEGAVHSYRPGEVLFRSTAGLLGNHPKAHYLIAETLVAGVAAALYVVLLRLRVPKIPAAVTATLLLVYPYADGVRLWGSAAVVSLATLLLLGSVFAGTFWVERARREGTALVLSLACLVAAILTYELVSPLILIPPVLFSISPNRRRTLIKTALDLAVGLPTAAYLFVESSILSARQPPRPWDQIGRRLLLLFEDGWKVLVVHGFPLRTRDLLAGLGAAALVAAALLLLDPRRRFRVPPWPATGAICAVGCLVAMFLSWVPLAPANDYYAPSTLGLGNRTNYPAQFFLLGAVVCSALTLGAICANLTRRTAAGAALIAFLLLPLFTSFYSASRQRSLEYLNAGSVRTRDIAVMHSLAPNPAADAVFLFGDYNFYYGSQWVPVFAAYWDLNGVVRLTYSRPTLAAYAVMGSEACAADGLREGSLVIDYRRLIVLDLDGGTRVPLSSQTECLNSLEALKVRLYPAPLPG